MNVQRRKRIAKAVELLTEAHSILEEVRDEEQDYYDNMPESFQSGEKGDKAQEFADKLSEAADSVESTWTELTEICEEVK